MSDKQKLTKSQRKKLKKSAKRKASGSPDSDEGGHLSASSPPCTSLTYTPSTPDLRDSERYVNTVLSFNTPPAMNIGQQNGVYGYQTTQQQQPYPPQTQSPALYNPTHMSPPAWAVPLIEDVKAIKSIMPKISEIENSVKAMNLKIVRIDEKMTNLETKVNEMENAVSFISNEQEIQKASVDKSKHEVKVLQDMCYSINQQLIDSKKREEFVTDKMLDLESRSMRENLMFYGIPETPTTTTGSNTESCEKLVKDLIATKLQLDASTMPFDRAHRIGSDRARKPRPIVVKFHQYTDRETVRRRSLEDHIKATLKGSNMGIGAQTPQQYREARKALLEHAKSEEQRGHKAKIVGTKLFVNNKPVKKYCDGSVVDL